MIHRYTYTHEGTGKEPKSHIYMITNSNTATRITHTHGWTDRPKDKQTDTLINTSETDRKET